MLNFSSITNRYDYNNMLKIAMNQKLASNNKPDSFTSKTKSSCVDSDGHLSSKAYTEIAHRLGYTDYHVSDGSPITVYSKELGYVSNDYQVLSKFYSNLCRKQDKEINEILNKSGIQLNPNDKLSFTVGNDYKVVVSGTENEELKQKIEQVLNSSENNFGSKLFSRSKVIHGFNGKLDKKEYDKWEVNNFLQNQVGLRLEDLNLVNSKVDGANDKLTKMLNSDEAGMSEYELHTYKSMMIKLNSLLAYGVEHISDLKYTLDFQNGSIIDKDLKYGFGAEQIKSWLPDIEAGIIPIDLKI